MEPSRIRCPHCELVQYHGEICRRCRRPLPAPQPATVEVVRVVEKVILATDLNETLDQIERAVIMARIEKLGGDICSAARSLGIGRNTIYRRLRIYRSTQSDQNETPIP